MNYLNGELEPLKGDPMDRREELDREFTVLTLKAIELDAKLKSLESTIDRLSINEKMKSYIYSDKKVKEYIELEEGKRKVQNRKQEVIRDLNQLLTIKNDAHHLLSHMLQ